MTILEQQNLYNIVSGASLFPTPCVRAQLTRLREGLGARQISAARECEIRSWLDKALDNGEQQEEEVIITCSRPSVNMRYCPLKLNILQLKIFILLCRTAASTCCLMIHMMCNFSTFTKIHSCVIFCRSRESILFNELLKDPAYVTAFK